MSNGNAARPRCAHREVMNDTVCAWPPGTVVTWHLDTTQSRIPATLTVAAALRAVAAGLALWPPVCGVTVEQVDDPAQARLLIGFASIDGPWNVLGETELPCDGRADVQHTMILDITEPWTEDYLRMVVAHEGGHGIGLGHAPDAGSVMSPFYNPALTTLQPWDVQQAQLRYGPPAQTPAPPATPPVAPTPATPPAGSNTNTVTVRFHADTVGDYELELTVSRVA